MSIFNGRRDLGINGRRPGWAASWLGGKRYLAEARLCCNIRLQAASRAALRDGAQIHKTPYQKGRHGDTYPDMAWEPKAAFTTIAECYRA